MIALEDTGLQARLEREGCATLDLLEASAADALRRSYDRILGKPAEGFVSTILDPDGSVRERCDTTIRRTLAPRLDALLQGHQIAFCSFATRSGPSDHDDVPLHQDWTFVDETRHRSYGVWVALEDTPEEFGCLQVVKGSHDSAHPPRPVLSGFLYNAIRSDVEDRFRVSIPLSKGQALLFDQRIFHRSAQNRRNRLRVAATAVILPAGVRMQLWIQTPKGPVSRFASPRLLVERSVWNLVGSEANPPRANRSADGL